MFTKRKVVETAVSVLLAAALFMPWAIPAMAASSYTSTSCTSSTQYGNYSTLTNETPYITTTVCTTYQHNPIYRTQPTYGQVPYTATRQVLQSQPYTAYRWGVTGSHQAVIGTHQVFAGYRYQAYRYVSGYTWRAVVYGYGVTPQTYSYTTSQQVCPGGRYGQHVSCYWVTTRHYYTVWVHYPLFYYERVPIYSTGYTAVAQFTTVPTWGSVPTYGWIAYTAYRDVLVNQTYTAYRWGVTGTQQVLSGYTSTPISSTTSTSTGFASGDITGSGYYSIPVPQN